MKKVGEYSCVLLFNINVNSKDEKRGRLFVCFAVSNDVKNSHILPTGKGTLRQQLTILYYLALSCTILHYLELSCTISKYLALSCTILHHIAP